MANRSYLYSTNFIPGTAIEKEARQITGMSEWNWDIPLVFKILISAHTKKCQSLIWEEPDEIALVGDHEEGVTHLMQFLEGLNHPAIGPLKAEARAFLVAEENKKPYFVLECGEIFEMEGESLAERNDLLLAEVSDLGPQVRKVIAELDTLTHEKLNPLGFVARLFGLRMPTRNDRSNDLIGKLGLGNWNNILYFDLT